MTEVYRNFYTKYRPIYGPDTCILLLVGKFYELFDYIDPQTEEPLTTIKRVCQIMNIALKEKPGHGPAGQTGLWGGIPEQSLHKFSQTLTNAGWTIVVVDQVKDANNNVTDRIPTRILSPGTHVEMAGQDRMSIAAIYTNAGSTAIAINDLTTGEVITYETRQSDEILHLIQIYCVKEIVSDSSPEETNINSYGVLARAHTTPFDTSIITTEEYFRRMFRIKSLLPVRAALGLGNSPEIDTALFSLLRFIEDHFPQQAERLTGHRAYNPENHMRLSNNILEQLNIITSSNNRPSILSLLDRTFSSIGKRALRERILRPITSPVELEARWSQVAFVNNLEANKRKVLERDLKGLYDIPRLHYKLASGKIEAADILQLFHSYSATFCLIENLRDSPLAYSQKSEKAVAEYRNNLFNTVFDETKAIARSEDKPIGFLTESAGPETFAVEADIQRITEAWESTLSLLCKSMGVSQDSFTIKIDSVGEYYLEAPRGVVKRIEQTKKFTVESKKSGPVRVSCAEFSEYSEKLRGYLSKLNRCLAKEALVVCDKLWDCVKGIQDEWIDWLGGVDVTMAFSAVGQANGWCLPSISTALAIEGLRHPLLESSKTRETYVKHDVLLGDTASANAGGWLIYGVNASGKSSLMKAVGISVILAQAGCPVPATTMRIRPYDAAFSRIWSHDNIWAGLSSFAVEVQELAEILKLATSRSLVLGDEVCSGTESTSATSLVAATLEHLDAKGAHFMFATHLHDLLKVPNFLPRSGIQVWHLRVITTPAGKLIYDRTLQPGSGRATYGLEVARAMGLPVELMTRAYAIRRGLGGEVAADEAPKSAWNSRLCRQSCEHCGSPKVRDLEVHHIHERGKGGDNSLRNLVVLCDACHDKHHANELVITPLTQTSEGLERFSYVPSSASASAITEATEAGAGGVEKTKKTKEWTVVEIETIKATIKKFKGRPPLRVATALQEEHGIIITLAQVKKFFTQS